MKPSNDREAITAIIDGIVSAGITLRDVDYGYGEDIVPVTTTAEAVDAIMEVDEATLNVVMPTGGRSFVFFVLGNDPEEVACDFGVSLSSVIDPIIEPWWV